MGNENGKKKVFANETALSGGYYGDYRGDIPRNIAGIFLTHHLCPLYFFFSLSLFSHVEIRKITKRVQIVF